MPVVTPEATKFSVGTLLNRVNQVPQMRKPFDVLAEGLISNKSRGHDNTLEPCVQGYVAPFLYRHPDVEMAKRVLKFSA